MCVCCAGDMAFNHGDVKRMRDHLSAPWMTMLGDHAEKFIDTIQAAAVHIAANNP